MQPLPIDPFLPEIARQVQEHKRLVIVAEPGAGKTTRVPPYLLRQGLLRPPNGRLVMLQPRRVAARASAARIAHENTWELGREVGYQVRGERRLGRDTQLTILTEGILTRQLVDDPFLEGVGCVILDEFHERHIDSGPEKGPLVIVCHLGRVARADGQTVFATAQSYTQNTVHRTVRHGT